MVAPNHKEGIDLKDLVPGWARRQDPCPVTGLDRVALPPTGQHPFLKLPPGYLNTPLPERFEFSKRFTPHSVHPSRNPL